MGSSHSSEEFSTNSIPDQHGKVVIITGGTAGLGMASAIELARKGAHVIITARSQRRGEEAVQKIKEALQVKDGSDFNVEYGIADQEDLKSVKAFASWFIEKNLPLHVLMLNAGVAFVPYRLIEGVESTLFINHVGNHLLTQLLLPKLRDSVPTRIVVVSSDAHKNVDSLTLDPPPPDKYNAWTAYGNSKLANILFTKALQKRLASEGIYANSIHPGPVATNIADKADVPEWTKPLLGFLIPLLLPSSSRGALTQLYAAASPDIEARGLKDGYFYPVAQLRAQLEPYAADEARAEQLWEWTESKVRQVLGDAS